MADLKELILQNIVKPALSGIPPTVLARVTGAKDKHFAHIEFPDFRRPQSDSTKRPNKMVKLENVRVGYTPGSPFARLNVGDAVWVTFLGHDIRSARIIAKAGRWAEHVEDEINSASLFEESEDFSHDNSANVPNAASAR